MIDNRSFLCDTNRSSVSVATPVRNIQCKLGDYYPTPQTILRVNNIDKNRSPDSSCDRVGYDVPDGDLVHSVECVVDGRSCSVNITGWLTDCLKGLVVSTKVRSSTHM